MRETTSDMVAILAFVITIPLILMAYIYWIIFGAILYISDHIIWKQKTKFITYENFILLLS